MNQNNPLLTYAHNIHSQRGEDGILAHIFDVLGISNGWCVEFGAWDGKHLSNTYALMEKGWSGVFIEGSEKRYQDLVATYGENKNAHPVCAFVNFDGENTLDGILSKTPITKDFDLLSIDIDGNDYHIWDSVKAYNPKVVIIEYNPAIPPHVAYVQPKDMKVNQGNSLLSVVNLGKEKGYELVATTLLNAIFVRKDLFSLFNVGDNSPAAMFSDKRYLIDAFVLYDGTVQYSEGAKVFWHGIPLQSEQPIPKIFRTFPSVMGPIKLFFFKVWRKIHNAINR